MPENTQFFGLKTNPCPAPLKRERKVNGINPFYLQIAELALCPVRCALMFF